MAQRQKSSAGECLCVWMTDLLLYSLYGAYCYSCWLRFPFRFSGVSVHSELALGLRRCVWVCVVGRHRSSSVGNCRLPVSHIWEDGTVSQTVNSACVGASYFQRSLCFLRFGASVKLWQRHQSLPHPAPDSAHPPDIDGQVWISAVAIIWSVSVLVTLMES